MKCVFYVSLIFLLHGCYGPIHKNPLKNNVTEDSFHDFTTPIFEEHEIDDDEDADADEEDIPVYDKNFDTPVSLSVTSDIQIKEVILQLASQAKVCVSISDNVSSCASLSINNKPFINVLDDICNMCNLRYNISGNSAKIEKDLPYLKTYNLQFLNISRESNASITSATDVFSNINSSGTQGQTSTDSPSKLDNGSSSSVKGMGKNDFWNELENTLKAMLNDSENRTSVTIHRQGGIIAVVGNSKQHKFINEYLSLLKKTTESQVLIEAKILEVSLFDAYKGGIDWATGGNFKLDINSVGKVSNTRDIETFSLGFNSKSFSSIVKFIEKFGAIKTLSSPRITVMNNQSAVLKVAKNEIISRPSIYRQFSSNMDSRNSDSMQMDIQTIPIGLVFTVQPAIDFKKKEVTLMLRPTLSRVVSTREVPTYAYVSGGTGSTSIAPPQTMQVPIVEVRELDSVLRMKSGQIIVMGGLMQEISSSERAGIPNSKNIPYIKHLLNGNADTTEITELVIFLRARIINKNNRKHIMHQKDAEYIKKYTNDARPLM